MTNRAVVDHRVTVVLPAFGPKVPARVRGYVHELARWQTEEGMARVCRRQLAAGMGVTERTITRWHREAERLGLVARVDGGHRGRVQTVRLLCTNPESPTERRTRRKAQAKHALNRRRRQDVNRVKRARRAAREAAIVEMDRLAAEHFHVDERATRVAPITTPSDAGATTATPRPFGPMATPAESRAIPAADPAQPFDPVAWRAQMAARGRAARRRSKW